MGIPCKFGDNFGDLYQNKLWGIYNNLNQFTHLSSAPGRNDDVIKKAAIKFKALVMLEFLAGFKFLSLFD